MKKQSNMNLTTLTDLNIKNDDIQRPYLNATVENCKYWQYNTIILYNIIMIYPCEWPSLFIEWLPNIRKYDDEYVCQDILLGTYTTDKNNYIMVLEVILPSEELTLSNLYYEKINDYRYNICNDTNRNFRVKCKIYHEKEINKICYNPQNTDMIACFSANGDINILNLKNYENETSDSKKKKAFFDYNLKGHHYQGWGLNWHPSNDLIVSCADDSNLFIWDIKQENQIVTPLVHFNFNNIPLQDCCWNDYNTVFTVSEKGSIYLCDIRTNNIQKTIKVNDYVINTIDINPHNNNIIATAGTNKEIDIWDIRNTNKCLHRIISQKESIIKIKWDYYQPGILASSSNDNYMYLFDTNKIGIEQSYEDSQDGPPELIFIHGGHSSTILDYSINTEFSMMVSSISEDNTLHIWQPSKQVFEDASETYEDTEVE